MEASEQSESVEAGGWLETERIIMEMPRILIENSLDLHKVA